MARRRSSISWRRSRRTEAARPSRASVSATAIVALVAAACEQDDDGTEIEAELEERLQHCASTLERLTSVAGSERAATLARGCPYACPGLEAYGQTPRDEDTAGRAIAPLARDCRFFCSERAREAWEGAALKERFPALVRACGRDYYGLREGTEAMFSDTWFVLHRIGVWLASSRSGIPDDAQISERLERATANIHIPLPLPSRAEEHFELSEAAAAEPVDALFYIVVQPDEIRAAAVRVARLRGQGIEVRPVPGGSFPGRVLPEDAEAMESAYRELEGSLRTVHRDPEVTAAPPLVLADGDLRAERLFRVASSLGQPKYRLGVAGRRALAHPVILERIPEFGSAAPTIELQDTEALVPGTEGPVAAGDEGREELDEALQHLVALRAPLKRIEVRPSEGTTLADLITLADAAHGARVRTMAFVAAETGEDEAPGQDEAP